ncbi:hypothetical protein [Streptomyces vilmorinianum]|uniref:hypothetical protein n=1 Tax=Streptomyces vilmorinianum TaxID=3051092 RepID=UPI0010FBA7F4|nr:hypothetical protein [Streptomyces vilmorinianum]
MQPLPEVGDLVRDTATGRVGFYVDSVAGRFLIRPVNGGVGGEWEAEPGDVQLATPMRELRARAAEINARSRRSLGT